MAAALERDRPILEQLIGDVGNQFGELFAIRAVDAFACAVYVLVSLILLIFKFKIVIYSYYYYESCLQILLVPKWLSFVASIGEAMLTLLDALLVVCWALCMALIGCRNDGSSHFTIDR